MRRGPRQSGPAGQSGARRATEPLGSATSLRFLQLIVLVVAGTVALSAQVAADLSSIAQGGVDNSLGCSLAGGLNPEAGLQRGSYSTLASYPKIQACIAKHVPDTTWVPFAAVALVLAGAAVLYLVLPRWKARGSRLAELETADVDGTLRRDLATFVREAGLQEDRVHFGIAVDALTSGAAVFGTRRQAVVRLHTGLLVTRLRNAERFRTVVMHELAHIRNRDIPITYATIALWRVFLAVVLIPALVDSSYGLARWREPSSWHLASIDAYSLMECAAIALAVYLVRADVLRVREHYADITAAVWWTVKPVDSTEPGRRPVAACSPGLGERIPAGPNDAGYSPVRSCS